MGYINTDWLYEKIRRAQGDTMCDGCADVMRDIIDDSPAVVPENVITCSKCGRRCKCEILEVLDKFMMNPKEAYCSAAITEGGECID